MGEGLFFRIFDRLSHPGENPESREARRSEEAEAAAYPKWKAWKLSYSHKDKWYNSSGGSEGCGVECPVEDLIYPQGVTQALDDKFGTASWLHQAPWNHRAWQDPLHQRLLQLVSDQYHDPNSPAREDAESMGFMDEQEYGFYMAKEHLRARRYGRRSRLDDVSGRKADDGSTYPDIIYITSAMSTLGYMSPQQAYRVGNGADTNIAFESHGSGKHNGETCPHRQLFDYEAQLPGTNLFDEAKRQGGISPDELWLKTNSRRRAAISTGNADSASGPWVALMTRILGFAPHGPVCGPHGVLSSKEKEREEEKLTIQSNDAAPKLMDNHADSETLKLIHSQRREIGYPDVFFVGIEDVYRPKPGSPRYRQIPYSNTRTYSLLSSDG
ncbi:MAG: hypothetical protein Q9168_004474 [Polycauliona sp. 1 TL-2023]